MENVIRIDETISDRRIKLNDILVSILDDGESIITTNNFKLFCDEVARMDIDPKHSSTTNLYGDVIDYCKKPWILTRVFKSKAREYLDRPNDYDLAKLIAISLELIRIYSSEDANLQVQNSNIA